MCRGRNGPWWAWLALWCLLSGLVPGTAFAEEPLPVYSSDLTLLREISAGLRAENEKLKTELESSRGNSEQLEKTLASSEEKIKAYDERLASVEDRLSKSENLATEASQLLTEARALSTSSIQSLTKLRAELQKVVVDGWIRTVVAAACALGLGWALGHFL